MKSSVHEQPVFRASAARIILLARQQRCDPHRLPSLNSYYLAAIIRFTFQRFDAIDQTVSGVGPETACAIIAFASDLRAVASGRNFFAWLGLMPRQRSTCGKASWARFPSGSKIRTPESR
ncbi:transposase [Sphingobium lactosutens]|uniref:transposase n=1 Tax=Sphingobium lactosutens TaxID=522773 RepID=UPI001C4B2BA4|nr:transposase [Sphingobium lactosutens]